MPKVLITGGAGFIGSHLADELLGAGYQVRALDCLAAQVHGTSGSRPAYLADEVELQVGDVRDADAVQRALDGVDGVFHLAAAVGVGQSMYEVVHYTDVNDLGTAVLLEALIAKPVSKLVVASSMSIYGEGLYHDAAGAQVDTAIRRRDALERREWEPTDTSGAPLVPIPTPESKPPTLASVYALSKYSQERMCMMVGEAYGIPTVALRLFNVFGVRQALSNPYTGALAIFASRLLNGKPPLIFEDGNQRRDFVSVTDVARAFRLAYESDSATGRVINVGGGRAYTIAEVAALAARAVNKGMIEPEITGSYRFGDIRHCFADISLAATVLDYRPTTNLENGLAPFMVWLEGQAPDDRVDQATAELRSRGLASTR